MSNPNKRKGTSWEVASRDVVNARGFDLYRPAQSGFKDTGDLHGLPHFAIQCKDMQSVTDAIRDALDGLKSQKVHAGARFGVAFVKRRRRSAEDGLAVMPLGEFADLMAHLRNVEKERDTAHHVVSLLRIPAYHVD
jgi:hypothetical protein